MRTTVAPGTTPPELSLTEPIRFPVVIWAVAGSAPNSSATRQAQIVVRVDLTIIELLPPQGCRFPLDLQSPTCNGLQRPIGVTRPLRRVNPHFALRNRSLTVRNPVVFVVKKCAFPRVRLLLPR